jgi:membrane fusion protein (multidrug efflux system)
MNQGFFAFSLRAVALSLVVLFFVAGCSKKQAAGGPPTNPPTSVLAAEAKKQSVAETLSVVGTLTANESIEVKAETDGTVAEILFQEGQPVKKGDLLIRLDETKYAAALAEAEASLKLSSITYERNKELSREKLVSQQEYDQAAAQFQVNQATVELRKRQLADTRIFAPFAGLTGSRLVSPGQVIMKSTMLTWLVDLDTVKAEFNVPERFLRELKIGQALTFSVAAYPKESFRGEVYFLAPQIDPNNRTLLMKARVPNADRKLKPGMFANLELAFTLREDAVVIPESALMSVGERTSVYVISAEGTAQMRPVKVGLRMPNVIEITQGLQVGEKVIAEGVQKVRPGGAVKIAVPGNAAATTNQPGAR